MGQIYMNCSGENPDLIIMGFTLIIIIIIGCKFKRSQGSSPTRWIMAIFCTILTKELVHRIYIKPYWCNKLLDMSDNDSVSHEVIFGVFPPVYIVVPSLIIFSIFTLFVLKIM